jgi:acetolactate synthase-1/2/3 large subunit
MSRTVAEGIVDALAEMRVEVVFGMPGVHNLALFAALEQSPIRTLVVRHEATAAYAADAVGRLTGSAGVCLTTSGPGAANAVTAMGEAQASRSPILHITTTVARPYLDNARRRGVLHEHPQQLEIFAPVSKSAQHIDDRSDIGGAIREALRTAAAPPKGPVYLQIPTDVLEEAWSTSSPNGAPPPMLAPTGEELRGLSSFLAASERPAIWIGSGAGDCGATVTRLAERLHAPIVLTHSAKRRWDAPGHPLVLAHPPHEAPVARLLERSDAVLVLGSDLDGMMTQEFRLPLDRIARVDVDPGRARGEAPYESVRAVVGAAGPVVEALLELLPERQAGWGPDAVREADTAAHQALAAESEAHGGLAFVAALDDALSDREAVVVCDMAVCGYWTGGYLPLRQQRRILYPLGWGTLGFALPASIGAASLPGAGSTVVVCGDGGSLLSIGELATLAQEDLDVTVVVHNDGCYGMLRYDEQRRFGQTFAVELDAPDFVGLARSFGLRAWRADLADGALGDVLGEALEATGPSLVEVTGALSPPRVTSARWPLTRTADRGSGSRTAEAGSH